MGQLVAGWPIVPRWVLVRLSGNLSPWQREAYEREHGRAAQGID